LFPLADVADHPQQVAVGHRGRDHFCREDRTVFTPELPLPVVIGLGFDRAQSRLDLLDFTRGNNVRCVQPDQFIARVTEHLAHAEVGIDVVAFGINIDDTVGRILE